jgi:hypothetical protein
MVPTEERQHRALPGSSVFKFRCSALHSLEDVLSDLRGYAFAAHFAEFQGTHTTAQIENATEPFGR